MKRTLVYGIATASLLLAVGACTAGTQRVESLYGPPPDDVIEPADEPDDPTEIDEPIEDVYGPPVDVDDEDEQLVVALYGPPPDEAVDGEAD